MKEKKERKKERTKGVGSDSGGFRYIGIWMSVHIRQPGLLG